MVAIFKKSAVAAGVAGVFSLSLIGFSAQAQDADTFDASVTTNAAVALACGQNLSFGTVYVGDANAETVLSLSALGAASSNDASVVVTGGTVGQCTVSGLQGADTATVTLSGASGTPAAGGLTGVLLDDGEANTLLAAIQVAGGVGVSGGKSGLANGVIPFFGSVTIPAAHVDFGTYDATLTATVALD